jgi:hypothetical protein
MGLGRAIGQVVLVCVPRSEKTHLAGLTEMKRLWNLRQDLPPQGLRGSHESPAAWFAIRRTPPVDSGRQDVLPGDQTRRTDPRSRPNHRHRRPNFVVSLRERAAED